MFKSLEFNDMIIKNIIEIIRMKTRHTHFKKRFYYFNMIKFYR